MPVNANVAAARSMLMSSGGAADKVLNKNQSRSGDGGAETQDDAWMSPRQHWLNWLWARYRTEQYDTCRVDWNGQEVLGFNAHDYVQTSGFLPGGFYDAGQTLPVKFRRPSAPVHFNKLIVARFTGLLFSAQRHPKVMVEGDPDTQDWLNAVIDSSRLWAHMIMARNYGGATGTGVLGFKFVRGKVQFEVHDPRFCTPVFLDKSTGELKSIEKRYLYTADTRDPHSGLWITGQFWYRRVIDEMTDTEWRQVPYVRDEEPDWDNEIYRRAVHSFGECPVHWIQNKEVQSEIDGDSDCHGVFDLIWAVDALYSQAHSSTLKNCDPTVHIATDAELAGLAMGSDNAMKTEKGGTMKFMEMQGSGTKVAMELAERLEARIQMIARCFVDTNTNRGGGNKTATEVERDFSSMIEEADVLREQYGERGVKPLLEKLLRAARKVLAGYIDRISDPEVPTIVKGRIVLPKKPLVSSSGEVKGYTDYVLGDGESVTLKWPPYFNPTPQDALVATQAATTAKDGGLVDAKHAAQSIASYFQVEDVQAMLKSAERESDAKAKKLQDQMMSGMRPGMTGEDGEDGGKAPFGKKPGAPGDDQETEDEDKGE